MPKKVKKTKRLPQYTYLGCPLTKNRSAWCFRLCVPSQSGRGFCGRLAPHSLRSRIQTAIDAYSVAIEDQRKP